MNVCICVRTGYAWICKFGSIGSLQPEVMLSQARIEFAFSIDSEQRSSLQTNPDLKASDTGITDLCMDYTMRSYNDQARIDIMYDVVP